LNERFADKPHVRQRLLEIADLIDQLVAQGYTAHEAEARAIGEIRKLGQSLLTEWAEKAEVVALAKARAQDPELQPYRKKRRLSWHSTYGEISVAEQRLRAGRRGRQVRPFCEQAQIGPRAYSQPLQRVLSDFGADHAFGQAVKKVREHYGVEVPASSVRTCTLAHAKASGAVKHDPPPAVAALVTEMDGSMLPIVQTQTGPGRDGRKGKQLIWREARVCMARGSDRVEAVYGASFESVQLAGLRWRQVAQAAGLGAQTRVHGLGDGAPWILSTFEDQFGAGPGSRAAYTIDFHHVSDYLAAAALVIAPARNKDWLHAQQELLLANQVSSVLSVLAAKREPASQKEAPVRRAYGYISERQQHMDYKGAQAAGLPIGSGEVESSHKHVLQKRLKLAGAWWLERNAEAMLQLRTVRANGDWDKYWAETARN
jgi:hypothetical protein